MTPFEQDVINYIDDIENTLSVTDNRINDLYVLMQQYMQEERNFKQEYYTESGDFIPIEQHQETMNNVGLVAIILTTSLIFTFILRSLK